MLVICEECSKKYNVDETMMKGPRARFSCYECGHVIVVVKSGPTGEQATPADAGGDHGRKAQ